MRCTWTREALGHVRHLKVWHLDTRDTEWIAMIMWDIVRHLDMWGTWICEALGRVTLNRLPPIHDVIGLYCMARGRVTLNRLPPMYDVICLYCLARMTPSEYVRHWMNRHLDMWALGYVRYWLNSHDYVRHRMDRHDYVRHRLDRHGYVGRRMNSMIVWDNQRHMDYVRRQMNSMIVWDSGWLAVIMWDNWGHNTPNE